MGCYILFLIVLHLLSTQIHAVNMCTSGSAASTVSEMSPKSTSVTLNLVRGIGSSGCRCSIKLENTETIGSNKLKISFEVVKLSGCKYTLDVLYNNRTSLVNCHNKDNFSRDINSLDEMKLYLESTSYRDETAFEIQIKSKVIAPGVPSIRLKCFAPITTPVTESAQRNSTAISSTTSLSNMTGAPNKTEKSNEPQQRDENLDIIIGGAVGGGLLLVIVVIIIVCIIRQGKKRKAKRDYDRPLVRASDPGYTDVVIAGQDGGNNSSREGVDNAVHSDTDSMSTQRHAQEMVIIENDLYVSSDDVMNSTSRDDDSNQKPDTVYAVVKKDRKPKNTTSTDGDDTKSSSERKFVIGPQGDEYALVTRN